MKLTIILPMQWLFLLKKDNSLKKGSSKFSSVVLNFAFCKKAKGKHPYAKMQTRKVGKKMTQFP
jgi:hypothetical protein